MSIWNFTRRLKLGDQAPKNPLDLCAALSPYKKGARQSQEIFLKVLIKISCWEKLSILNVCFKWSATRWVMLGFSFFFSMPSLSLWLLSPAWTQESSSEMFYPANRSSANKFCADLNWLKDSLNVRKVVFLARSPVHKLVLQGKHAAWLATNA